MLGKTKDGVVQGGPLQALPAGGALVHQVPNLAVCCAGFMILWCSFLPFALWEICGWATPAVEAAIAFLLLGIENVGAHLWCTLWEMVVAVLRRGYR